MYIVENERRTESAKNRLVTHFANERHTKSNIDQDNFSVEITDLPKGIYFLKIGDQINFETFKLLE